jgi:hypothetical protein
MPFALVLLLAAGAAQPAPLTLEATRESTVVEIRFELTSPLPEDLSSALESGAEVRLTYPLRLKAKRKAWWDRRIWAGELVTITAFDPVTGRYRCELVLDGIVTGNREVESLEAAIEWLRAPAPVRVEVPENRRRANLKVRVRAVFSSGTTWLIFPTQDATPWVEAMLSPPPEPPADAD